MAIHDDSAIHGGMAIHDGMAIDDGSVIRDQGRSTTWGGGGSPGRAIEFSTGGR
ncbi:hypothetical protein [Streptomyces sp. NPDC001315]|uniref:hypothetical protein n=1 Tax=Streptomyces sp. NPDC001315 TaxID=3364562 RepID=UPI0036961A2D